MTEIDFSFGRYGNSYSEGTATVGNSTSEYHAIHILSDAVIDTITDHFGNTWYNGKTFTKNTMLFGRFKTIKLTSGSMVAYKSYDF